MKDKSFWNSFLRGTGVLLLVKILVNPIFESIDKRMLITETVKRKVDEILRRYES